MAEPQLTDIPLPPDTPMAMPEALDNPQSTPTLLGATWRNTMFGSVLSSDQLYERSWPTDPTPIDTDQILANLERDRVPEEYWDHFVHTKTVGEYSAILRDIESDRADQAVFEEAGMLKSLGAGLLVGLADPINWIPIGRAFNIAKGTASVLSKTASIAAIGAVTAGIQEPFLQAGHELRDWRDGVTSIAGTTLLSGFVGGVGATIASPGAQAVANRLKGQVKDYLFEPYWNQQVVNHMREAHQAIQDEIAKNPQGVSRIVQGPTKSGQAGFTQKFPSVEQVERADKAFDALDAAEKRMELWRDNSMYRTGPMEWARTAIPRALGAFHPGFLDPSDFLMRRVASVEAKTAWQNMGEVVQLLNKNVHKFEPTAQGATTELDWYTGNWAHWRNAMWGGSATEAAKSKLGVGESYFAKARKNGFAGNAEEFDKAVHYAVSRGYVDSNPAIQKAAEHYKKNFVDPLRELMIRAGYPDPGDSPRFALGYAPRRYVVSKVRGLDGRGTEFKAVVGRAFLDERMEELRLESQKTGVPISKQAEAGARRWAENKARDAYNNITGVNSIADGGINWSDMSTSSPFEKRVVPLSDELLLSKGWIDARITDSAHIHMRQTVPSLLYATRFKTKAGKPDPSLENSVIPKIDAEYKMLAATIGEGGRADAIIREGQRVIEVLRNQRDAFLLGPGFVRKGEKAQARMMEAAMSNVMTWQAMRLLSNLVPASLPDLAGIQFQHGMGRFLKTFANDVAKYFKANPPNFKGMSRQEVQEELVRYGAAIEWASNAGVAAHMDLNSPFQASNGAITRATHSMARVFSVSNGSMWWNDTVKGKAFRATMDRVLAAAEKGWSDVPDFDKRFLANHGIGAGELHKIGDAWRRQSAPLNDGYLRMGIMSSWGDKEAARLLSNAIAKNRASTVVQPRVGDKNYLATANPVLRMILQFQSFIFSHSLRVLTLAEQRAMADGFYGRDALRVYGGLASYIGLGMLSYWVMQHAYDYAKGVPDGEKSRVDKLYDNPGQWISMGLEKSGVTGLVGNYNMMLERMGGKGITRALQTAAGDEQLNVEAKDRWRDREPAQALVGPFFSQSLDLAKTGKNIWNHAWTGEGLRRSDIKTLSEVGPWQNNIFVRRHILDPAARAIAEDYFDIAWDR